MTYINGNFTYHDAVGFGYHRKRDIDAILAAQDGRCYFCSRVLEERDGCIKFDKDHLQPLCKEGTNWPDNLAQPLRAVFRHFEALGKLKRERRYRLRTYLN